MKFDVVVGNPPYNKGMDLDFVNLAFDLSKKYVVMITPAKWQTAPIDQKLASKTINYQEFRNKIVPHMSKVVFYPDCKDVFDIEIPEGITYYLIDKKNRYNLCNVINRCSIQPKINSEANRSIQNMETLWNIGQEIIGLLKEYKKFTFMPYKQTTYEVWANEQVSFGKISKSYLFSAKGNLLVTGIADIINKSKREKFASNTSKPVFYSNSEVECRSFISWYYSKLVRFMVLINISKQSGVLNNDAFRFVPTPTSGNFDHTYTDEELYKEFNIPQKYIDVIEAIIKDRSI